MLREQEEEGIDHGLSPHRFKWWFNYMSWGPGQLDSQVSQSLNPASFHSSVYLSVHHGEMDAYDCSLSHGHHSFIIFLYTRIHR